MTNQSSTTEPLPENVSQTLLHAADALDRARHRARFFIAGAEALAEDDSASGVQYAGDDLLDQLDDVAQMLNDLRHGTTGDHARGCQIRGRIIIACRRLGEPYPNLDVADEGALIDWARDHGVSIDWLVLGERRPMMVGVKESELSVTPTVTPRD